MYALPSLHCEIARPTAIGNSPFSALHRFLITHPMITPWDRDFSDRSIVPPTVSRNEYAAFYTVLPHHSEPPPFKNEHPADIEMEPSAPPPSSDTLPIMTPPPSLCCISISDSTILDGVRLHSATQNTSVNDALWLGTDPTVPDIIFEESDVHPAKLPSFHSPSSFDTCSSVIDSSSFRANADHATHHESKLTNGVEGTNCRSRLTFVKYFMSGFFLGLFLNLFSMFMIFCIPIGEENGRRSNSYSYTTAVGSLISSLSVIVAIAVRLTVL